MVLVLAVIEVVFAFAGYDLQLYLVEVFAEGVNAWWGLPLLAVYLAERLILLAMTAWIVFSSFGDNEEDYSEIPSLFVTLVGALGSALLLTALIRTEISLEALTFEGVLFGSIYLICLVCVSAMGVAQASRFS